MFSDKRASVSTPTRMATGRRVQERTVDPSDVTLVLFIAVRALLESRRDLDPVGPLGTGLGPSLVRFSSHLHVLLMLSDNPYRVDTSCQLWSLKP